MHNLYCLAPDIQETKSVVDELREMGVREDNIYVVANDHESVQRANLHEADLEDSTDIYDAFKRGVLIGGVFGLLGGIAFTMSAPPSVVAGFGTVLLIGTLGAALGAWTSAMIGISVIDPGLERYVAAIDEGNLLIMVDVPPEDEGRLKESIRLHHPRVLVEGQYTL